MFLLKHFISGAEYKVKLKKEKAVYNMVCITINGGTEK